MCTALPSLPSRPRQVADGRVPLGTPNEGSRVYRGHAIGHSLGGPDEGLNLFAQDAGVNLGREWRSLERCCAWHGTFLFVRCAYSVLSSVPSALEFSVLKAGDHLDVRLFPNAWGCDH